MKGNRGCLERGWVHITDVTHCGNENCENCNTIGEAFKKVAEEFVENIKKGDYPSSLDLSFKIKLPKDFDTKDDPTLGELLAACKKDSPITLLDEAGQWQKPKEGFTDYWKKIKELNDSNEENPSL